MHCFHIFLRCVDILATLTILSHGNAERLQTYLRSDMENHAQFVSHYDSILNIPHMASLKVHDSMTCVVQCVRHEVCHSVNFAVDTDGRGYHFCELLPSDKYQFPDEFEKSYSHHHYSIASPCENSPCRNGASCLPLYGSNGFICEQHPGKIEKAAPWLKASANNVCFGARDDSYGSFTIPWSGVVVSLKLVYISGYVSCQSDVDPYGSHWGCRKANELTTLVTNGVNKVIFPQDYKNKSYTLSGYHFNSSDLVFNRLSPPLTVAAGEEFRIWYKQDFDDKRESNNVGHTCADVYVLVN